MPDPWSTVEQVHRLKQEIDTLTEEQNKELQRAIFVGMSPTEAKEYDARRQEITLLVRQLEVLSKAQRT
jgi:hypothetical protein